MNQVFTHIKAHGRPEATGAVVTVVPLPDGTDALVWNDIPAHGNPGELTLGHEALALARFERMQEITKQKLDQERNLAKRLESLESELAEMRAALKKQPAP